MKILNTSQIQYHNDYICIYLDQHLSGLDNLTPPNKQSFEVKSEFKSRHHIYNSQTIKRFIIFGRVKVDFYF